MSTLTNHLIHSHRLQTLLKHKSTMLDQIGSSVRPSRSFHRFEPKGRGDSTTSGRLTEKRVRTPLASKSTTSGQSSMATSIRSAHLIRPLVAKLSPTRASAIETRGHAKSIDHRTKTGSKSKLIAKSCTCSTSDSGDGDALSSDKSHILPDYCCTHSLLLDQRRLQIRLQQQIRQLQQKLDGCSSLSFDKCSQPVTEIGQSAADKRFPITNNPFASSQLNETSRPSSAIEPLRPTPSMQSQSHPLYTFESIHHRPTVSAKHPLSQPLPCLPTPSSSARYFNPFSSNSQSAHHSYPDPDPLDRPSLASPHTYPDFTVDPDASCHSSSCPLHDHARPCVGSSSSLRSVFALRPLTHPRKSQSLFAPALS
jgi:hypothetical protein